MQQIVILSLQHLPTSYDAFAVFPASVTEQIINERNMKFDSMRCSTSGKVFAAVSDAGLVADLVTRVVSPPAGVTGMIASKEVIHIIPKDTTNPYEVTADKLKVCFARLDEYVEPGKTKWPSSLRLSKELVPAGARRR